MENLLIDLKKYSFDKLIDIQDEIELHESWKFISKFYHTSKEESFLLSLLEGYNDKIILDPSYGCGFLINLLLRNKFKNIYTSDIPTNNLLKQNIKDEDKINCFYSYFQNLNEQTILKSYDIIMVVGASLSYCQNWEKNKIVELDLKEVFKSIRGLKSVLKPDGILYIGNAKNYQQDKKEIIQSFFDNDNKRVMKWTLNFDWERKEKKWTCEIFNPEQQNLIENFSLNSHLFSNDIIKEYCGKYFKDVKIIIAPDNCPEDIIKCTNPK